ncbi:MAG: DUF503 domain-containing protein [Gammaproteobacteria bacterium]
MFIGVLSVKLNLPEVHNLKEKRQIIQSIIGRTHSHYKNVSVAEIDYQDLWQSTLIGIVSISNEAANLQKILTKILNFINESQSDFVLEDHKIEIQHW